MKRACLAFFLVFPLSIYAAGMPPQEALRRMHEKVERLRHVVRELKETQELHTEKLNTMEDVNEELSDRIKKKSSEVTKALSGQVNDQRASHDEKFAAIYKDIATLKDALNKNASCIERVEKELKLQSKEFAQVKDAISSLIASMEGEELSIGDVHVVKSGDTLGGIALKYKVSVKKLKEENDLKKDVIRVGQKLRIPSR